jgi:putative two-component system hydrogenase maturation factor HypX/HoxX
MSAHVVEAGRQRVQPLRILLLCSAFNGLSQRAWIELRADGHDVTVGRAGDEETIRRTVADADPDLVMCPFLRERVPADVWGRWRTIIVHPGPKGDRGPSSLDWAITDAEASWGVTALQAVEEMDAGPVWGTRTFSIGSEARRKSSLYNGPVADAAIELIREVAVKAADPRFVPEQLDDRRPDVTGRLRPTMRQSDREFSWADASDHIVRRIRAADGSPGVRTELCGLAVSVFDAHVGTASTAGAPGTVALRRHGAVLVRTGDGAVWIGHARVARAGGGGVKLPATMALGDRLDGIPASLERLAHPPGPGDYREIIYRRSGDVGILRFDFYNGAMSTGQCRRLGLALRHAAEQDTRVLVVSGGEVFSNGIHLNVIEAAPHPAVEAWRNINAIDDVCRSLITCTSQLVMSAVSGNAGAGGVMLALGADRVLLRESVVLNPHYGTMGLFGSEYWTYVLPRRVGQFEAEALTDACLPLGPSTALRLGLADEVLPGSPAEFEAAVVAEAERLARRPDYAHLLAAKQTALAADELRRPLDAYRIQELAEMSRDIFDDRNSFAAARRAFVTKQRSLPPADPAAMRRGDKASSFGRSDATDLAG